MHENEILKLTAKRLRLEKLPENVVEAIRAEGLFRDVENLVADPASWNESDRQDWAFFIGNVKQLLKSASSFASPHHRQSATWLPREVIEERELRHAVLESELAAERARRTSRVQRFRKIYLDGEPLPDVDAKQFLERIDQLRVGVAHLRDGGTFFELNDRLVHVWDDITEALLADVQDDTSDGWARVVNDEVSYGHVAHGDPEWDTADLPPGMFVRMPTLAISRTRPSTDVDAEHLSETRRALHQLGDWLSSTFDWRKDQAIWFALTDRTPFVSPLEVEVHWERRYTHDRASVNVRARRVWVSQETVAKAYGRAQRRLLATPKLDANAPDADRRDRKMEVDNKPTPLRNLAVFAFVQERKKLAGKRPPWNILLNQWNSEHDAPDERFPNLHRLQEAYSRAKERLEHPRYLVDVDRPPKRRRKHNPH